MARQTHVAVEAPNPDGDALAEITFAATHATNKEQTLATGREVIVFYNSGATPRVCTVTSIACSHGRTGDVSSTVGAGEFWVSPRIPLEGFRQTDGYIYFEAAHAEILVSVIRAGN